MITNANNRRPRLVIIGDYLFDPGVGLISGPSGAHYVCPQLASVLTVLIKNAGSTVTHDHLLPERRESLEEESPALLRLVERLKRYFEDNADQPSYIETVPGKGYRLVAPVYSSSTQPALQSEPRRDNHARRTGRLESLFNEFRNRKVCRSVLIYSAVIWLAFEITDLVAEALFLPEWIFPVVVYLGILGFPIAAVLSWIFDLTPEGIVRDGQTNDRPAPRRKKTDLVLDFTLVLAAIAICSSLVLASHTGGSDEAHADPYPVPSSESVYEDESGDTRQGTARWAG